MTSIKVYSAPVPSINASYQDQAINDRIWVLIAFGAWCFTIWELFHNCERGATVGLNCSYWLAVLIHRFWFCIPVSSANLFKNRLLSIYFEIIEFCAVNKMSQRCSIPIYLRKIGFLDPSWIMIWRQSLRSEGVPKESWRVYSQILRAAV
jgi:hypothetical protein